MSKKLKIKQEWERTVLLSVLLLILITLGIAYTSMQNRRNSGESFMPLRTPHEYFDTKSKSYMSMPSLDGKARNPLAYALKVKIPPAKPQPKPQPAQQKPAPKPAAKPAPQVAQKPATPAPKPIPPEKVSVTYRGQMQFDGAETIAFCTSVSDKDKKKVLSSLHKGDKVHGQFTINEITSNELTLTYKGENIAVQRGKTKVITLK